MKKIIMESTNTVVFTYSVTESIAKVKTSSGVRLEIESYSCIDGISDGPHHLRLRRASHSNYDHQVTLKLTAPDCKAMFVQRTLVFNRGTTLLNLKIDKEEILYLMGPARRTKLQGELSVKLLDKSTGVDVPVNSKELDVFCATYAPFECNPLKKYESRFDLSTDIEFWQKEDKLAVDPVILEL